ncbi:hypothetical protein CDL12_22310 [Handroanthus impetiginosus]|uniref:Uncharacterized protein n=1 Tax=Handroanthus impetiginosus TaxID=429701 RepID=A0A2G9GIR7_9LAMI|nr:hypothetical protein CDL12_22310 [Handroanthus impetiginosus]
MEEGEGKLDPALPPNYVSLAQLQKRWIQKQQEKKLKKKVEEEQRERDERSGGWINENQNQRGLGNDLQEEMAGLSLRDVPRRQREKDGRKMGAIEDKGKGKEKIIGGFQDGEEKKNNRRKKKSSRAKKSMADGEKEKHRSEIKELDGGDETEGVEIVPGNEVKVGIKGVLSRESSGRDGGEKRVEEIRGVYMAEVLPRNEVRKEIQDAKRVEYRSGFRRNGHNQGSGYESKKEYGNNVDDEKGYGKWRRERRRNGGYREHYRLKGNRNDVLEGNEAETKADDEAEDEVLEVCNEIGGANENKKNDDRVELEKKVDDEVLVVGGAKGGENGRVGNGYRRYGNLRENVGRKFGGFTYNDRSNVRSKMGVNDGFGRRYTRFGSFEYRRKTKPRESGMVWVKKEEKNGADAAEVGSSGIPVDQA